MERRWLLGIAAAVATGVAWAGGTQSGVEGGAVQTRDTTQGAQEGPLYDRAYQDPGYGEGQQQSAQMGDSAMNQGSTGGLASFDTIDENGDGTIDRAEFAAWEESATGAMPSGTDTIEGEGYPRNEGPAYDRAYERAPYPGLEAEQPDVEQ